MSMQISTQRSDYFGSAGLTSKVKQGRKDIMQPTCGTGTVETKPTTYTPQRTAQGEGVPKGPLVLISPHPLKQSYLRCRKYLT